MNREFEELFRKKFENFEGEVSPDLFDKIIAERKKSRKAAWYFQRRWWIAAAALLLIGTTSVLLWNNKSEVNPDTPVVQNEEDLTNQQHTENNLHDIDVESTESDIDDQLTDDAVVQDISGQHVEQNIVPREIEDESGNNTPYEETEEGGFSLDNDASDETNDEEQVVADIDTEEPLEDEVIVEDGDEQIDVNTDEDSPVLAHTDDDPEMEDADQGADKKDQNNARPRDPHKGRSVVSLNFYGGPGAAYRTLRSDDQDLVRRRNNTEGFGLSYQFTAQVGYHFNRWSLWTGLNFSRNTHSFMHKEKWETTDTNISSREVVIVNPPPIGTVIKTVYDTSFTVNRFEKDHSTTNAINMVSLPIELERSFQIGNRMELMAKAGVSFNILTLRTGRMLSANGEVLNIASLPYTSVGLGNTSVALGASYRLSNKCSLMFYPHFNYNLEPAFDKSLGFTQNDFSFYSHFGIRIDL